MARFCLRTVLVIGVAVSCFTSAAFAATCKEYDGGDRPCNAPDVWDCNGSREECVGLGFYYVPYTGNYPVSDPNTYQGPLWIISGPEAARTTVAVPELEDYAAAAFLVLALTIGWQVRQRRVA